MAWPRSRFGGAVSLLNPIDAPELKWLDLGLMLLVSIALLPVVKSGSRVSRLEGAVLLIVYVAYTAWLLRSAGA